MSFVSEDGCSPTSFLNDLTTVVTGGLSFGRWLLRSWLQARSTQESHVKRSTEKGKVIQVMLSDQGGKLIIITDVKAGTSWTRTEEDQTEDLIRMLQRAYEMDDPPLEGRDLLVWIADEFSSSGIFTGGTCIDVTRASTRT
jgi:hypothetical protein